MKKNYYLKSFLVVGSLILSASLWASKVTVGNFTAGALQTAVETAQGGVFVSDTLEITGSVQFATEDYTYLKGLVAVMDMSNYEFSDAKVPAQAFLNAKMTGLALPQNTKVLATQSFKGCSGLKSVVIPTSVDTIGDNSFDSCSELLSTVFLSDNTILKSQVFRNCFKLVSVNIPSKNKKLEGTFYSCRALPSVYIPATVDSIGASTFFGCENMKTLYMAQATPPKITNTGVFRFTTMQIVVPKGSLAAYKAANVWKDLTQEFWEADVVYVNNFESGKLQDAVETKAGGAFNKDVLVIGGNVLFATADYTYIKSLTSSLDVSSYVFANNSLPENAFLGATFNAITLPASLNTIGRYALQDCKMITSINIPTSVDSIASSVFSGCSKLKRVNFAEDGKIRSVMNAVFESCTSLDSVTLPNSITTLGGNVFLKCTGLKYSNIPTEITWLNGTFQSCSALSSITIPETITKIDYQTFWDCTSLQTIYSENPTPPTVPSVAVFGGVPRTAVVYVNDETAKAAYETAPKWSDLVAQGFTIRVKGSTGIGDVKTVPVAVNIYPNPVVDLLNIESSGDDVLDEVVVSGLNGQLIGRYNPAASSFSLSTTDWSDGVYMVKVVAGRNTSVCKIVKK